LVGQFIDLLFDEDAHSFVVLALTEEKTVLAAFHIVALQYNLAIASSRVVGIE
jgi:phosphatidylglycerophosphate synthase